MIPPPQTVVSGQWSVFRHFKSGASWQLARLRFSYLQGARNLPDRAASKVSSSNTTAAVSIFAVPDSDVTQRLRNTLPLGLLHEDERPFQTSEAQSQPIAVLQKGETSRFLLTEVENMSSAIEIQKSAREDSLTENESGVPPSQSSSAAQEAKVEDKGKKKKKSRGGRMAAAFVNAASRILAQMIGAASAVFLGMFLAGKVNGGAAGNQPSAFTVRETAIISDHRDLQSAGSALLIECPNGERILIFASPVEGQYSDGKTIRHRALVIAQGSLP
jgi:hypothetical protein